MLEILLIASTFLPAAPPASQPMNQNHPASRPGIELIDANLTPDTVKTYAEALSRLPTNVPAERALQGIQARKAQIEADHDAAVKKENQTYREQSSGRRSKRQKQDDAKDHADKLKQLREKRDAQLKTIDPLFNVCRKLVDAQKQAIRVEVYIQFHQDKKAAAALTAAARMHVAAVSAMPGNSNANEVSKALGDGIHQYTVMLTRITKGYPAAVLPLLVEADKSHRELLAKWQPATAAGTKNTFAASMSEIWSTFETGTLSQEEVTIAYFWRHQADPSGREPN